MKSAWSWKTSLLLVDAVAITGGFTLAYWLRFLSGWVPVPKGIPPFDQHLGYLLFVLLVWLILFYWCGLYRQRVQGTIDEAYSILVGVAAGSIALLGAAYWQQAYWYSRGLLILAAIATASLMLLIRRLLRGVWQARYERGVGILDTILVGEAAGCTRVAAALSRPWTGYRVLGRVQPPYDTDRIGALDETHEVANDLAVWGTWSDLLATVSGATSQSENDLARPSEIVLIGNCLRGSDAQILADLCSASNPRQVSDCSLRLVPDVLDIVKRSSPLEEVVGVPLLTLSSHPVSLPGRLAKRLLDIFVALPLTLLLAPLMSVLALAVKGSSAGPALYRQVRCGRNGQHFEMLKFRTMSAAAEIDGARFATRGDTRVTPLGRWLRRTSLDELPQLINVLKGEMSLVGPRPERPVFVEKFGSEIPRYHERHRMPTGITGWAQVNGLRGDTPIGDRTLYDLYYVENWSVALDLKILLKTACEVLFHREAY